MATTKSEAKYKKAVEMMKSLPKKRGKVVRSMPDSEELELDPDAWPKFESLVKSAAKMGHKPHDTKARKKRD